MNHAHSPSGRARASPLHDRLVSPPPDPVKSAILRDSGHGWSSHANQAKDSGTDTPPAASSASPPTTPLRISKRGSPQRALARRQSSSYNHLRNNNLVTNSPFRHSMIPTRGAGASRGVPLGPRKVSGEKRPRPESLIDDQAENERPQVSRRRQSKGYIGLTEKEPVTKSPFRQPSEGTPPVPAAPPPTAEKPKLKISAIPTRVNNASPSRPALVSRRLHGPRSPSSSPGNGSDGTPGRRARRKTVSFNERCDVLEFEQEEHEMRSDPFDEFDSEKEHHRASESESESTVDVPMDEHGLDRFVDNVWRASAPSPETPANSDGPEAAIPFPSHSSFSTPPHGSPIPADMHTEDGVPLGRSTHIERQRDAHGHVEDEEMDEMDDGRPTSPSPMKLHAGEPSLLGGPPITFDLEIPRSPSGQGKAATLDPFALLTEGDASFLSERDYSNASICISDLDEVVNALPLPADDHNHDHEDEEVGILPKHMQRYTPPIASTPPLSLSRRSQSPRAQSPHGRPITSPRGEIGGGAALTRSPIISPRARQVSEDGATNLNGSLNGRSPRISREEVQKRLMKQRSFESPLREDWPIPPSSHVRPPLPTIPSNGSGSGSRSGSPFTSSGSPRLLKAFASSPSPRASGTFLNGSPAVSASNSPSPFQTLSRGNGDGSSESISITSTEIREATIQRAEKLSVSGSGSVRSPGPAVTPHLRGTPVHMASGSGDVQMQELDFGPSPAALDADFDFGQPGVEIGDMRSALDRLMADVASPASASASGSGSGSRSGSTVNPRRGSSGMRVEEVTEGVQARSLDVADVSVTNTEATDPDDDDDDMMTNEGPFLPAPNTADLSRRRTSHLDRATTDSALLPSLNLNNAQRFESIARTGSGSDLPSIHSDSYSQSQPPPVPAKDNIRAREDLIREKRRQARALEDGLGDVPGGLASPRARNRDFSGSSHGSANGGHAAHAAAIVRANSKAGGKSAGRSSRRRSLSTGDAEDLGSADRAGGVGGGPGALRRGARLEEKMGLLVGVPFDSEEDPLADSIEKELMKLEKKEKPKAYHVKERDVIYASADTEKVSHMERVGDIDTGRAWKSVRRPSDMNEYSRQIKELRAQEKPGKAHGKVFVRVVGIKDIDLPLPAKPTIMTCTLNNGIHFVTTPEARLEKDATIDQEFELIEHSKLEFTLTLKIRRDQHIVDQFKSLSAAPSTQAPPTSQPQAPVQKSGGMRGFFGGSPKKMHKATPPPPVAPQPAFKVRQMEENLARYLRQDGTLARAFIAFKDVARHCDTRLLETCYPLIGQKSEINGTTSTVQIGEIRLQIFRLPSLPTVLAEQLPQSLEECQRGLRHLHWHKVTYLEGTLTQQGGDCSTWRRRQFRLIGANLVAFNDVTKRAITTIDLKKAVTVEDEREARTRFLGSSDAQSPNTDDFEGVYGVDRSFRLVFPRGQEITFFADTDEEKARWLEVFRAIIGRIPPNPLWAELVWQRQNELAKTTATTPS